MGSTFVSYSSFFLENHQMKDCKMYILALLSRLFSVSIFCDKDRFCLDLLYICIHMFVTKFLTSPEKKEIASEVFYWDMKM